MRGEGVRAALAALVLAAAGASPAAATSVAELGLDEAVRAADAVVRARVAAVEEAWGHFGDDPAIVTTYHLAGEEALRGAAPGRVVAFGGSVGDRTMTLEGQPRLAPGSEVVLLLCRGSADSPFVGVWQGAYEVRQGRIFRGARAVVDVVAGRVLLARDGEPGMRVEAFLDELRAAIERVARREPVPLELLPAGQDRPLLLPLDPDLTGALRRRAALQRERPAPEADGDRTGAQGVVR